jgi:transposase InsO family protein
MVWRVLSARGLARLTESEPLQRFVRLRGKVHLVALVDDATRICLGGQWVRRKTEAAVLGALVPVFCQWGVPDAVLSDRGPVFFGPATRQAGRTTYQLALETLGVRACFAKPYKPRTKGKVEKFIQFVVRDFVWRWRTRWPIWTS